MSGDRARILGAIRTALARDALPETTVATLDRRLKQPRVNVVPARGRVAAADLVETFVTEAELVNTTTARLAGVAEVPAAVVTYLRAANMAQAVRVTTDPLMQTVPWANEPLLRVTYGAAANDDGTSVTTALAGVAETGTLILASSGETPTSLNFLPEVHIVLLPTDRIVGAYEDAWQRLRGQFGSGVMPRVVNWITGPSRTADIEQTLLLGAHGPKRLHILLIDGNEAPAQPA